MTIKPMLLSALILSTTSNITLTMNPEKEEIKKTDNSEQLLSHALAFGAGAFLGAMMNQPEKSTPEQKIVKLNLEQREDKVFDKGSHTKINGNEIWDYRNLSGYMSNPSPEFKHTKIVQLTKNEEYREQDTIGQSAKAHKMNAKNRSQRLADFDKFDKHAKANNAIVCYNVMQQPNRDGELKNIDAIIYGTQNINHCNLYKEFLKAQNITAIEKNINY